MLGQLQQQLETCGSSSWLRSASALALGHAALVLPECRAALAALPSAPAAVEAAAVLLQDREPKIARRAAYALGFLGAGHEAEAPIDSAEHRALETGVSGDAVQRPAAEALLSLRTSKHEEVLRSVGDALCFVFGGTELWW